MRSLSVAAACLVLAQLGCAGKQIYTGGIPNLVSVHPGVYRSGQPTTPADWRMLWERNVRHVVKLDFDDEGSDRDGEAIGMDVHRVPLQPSTHGWDIFSMPTTDAMGKLWGIAMRIRAEGGEGGGWLIHCKNGHDRTGLVVALIRMVVDRWTPEQAWREMLERGYHPELLGLNRAFWEFADLAQGVR